ncbi:MAG: diaminopimelate epimerase [Cyanobacteria bacterium J06638_20]
MGIAFRKYHGLGNDFILLDNRHQPEPLITQEEAIKWCDRHFGIGADGVIFALPAQGDTDYTMRIFNSDGSEPEMCGNGIRCMAKFLADLETAETGSARPNYRVHTLAGLMVPQMEANGEVTVDMGMPWLLAEEIPTTLAAPGSKVIDVPLKVAEKSWQVTCVSMGNPHCITFVEDVTAIPLETLGPQFENHPAFPKRINTEFIQVVRPDYLKMRVWERGAGATLACGTGACAALVAGVLNGKCDRSATLELPGGNLHITWDEADQHLFMMGSAELAFTGEA